MLDILGKAFFYCLAKSQMRRLIPLSRLSVKYEGTARNWLSQLGIQTGNSREQPAQNTKITPTSTSKAHRVSHYSTINKTMT